MEKVEKNLKADMGYIRAAASTQFFRRMYLNINGFYGIPRRKGRHTIAKLMKQP